MVKKVVMVKIPDEIIMNQIYYMRGQKVMIDRDIAELYGVATKRLKESVNRNIDRFPDDFMFEISPNWRSQIATSNFHSANLIHSHIR